LTDLPTIRLYPKSVANDDEELVICPDESPPLVRAVGNYVVHGVLHRGGMGVIYRAYDPKLNRPVALKMILAGAHADMGILRRFRDEARAVARLGHPNIVQIYEVGEQDGLPYLALEFIDGPSLSQVLSNGPLAPSDAARLVMTLAGAVDVAHRHGVIHRDLKPGNILIATGTPRKSDPDLRELLRDPLVGIPKITDFGLAKLREGSESQTRTGEVVGTPGYMAPEQADDTHTVGPVADIYSLGAILYETLTGRPPHLGGTPMETLLSVRLKEPPGLRRFNPAIPRDLETICLKCLRKDRDQRYASAAELAADLGRFLAGLPITARPTGTIEQILKWAKRHPTVATLASAMFGLAVIAFLAVFGLWRAAATADAHARFLARSAVQAHIEEHLQRERAERALYALSLSSAEREWLTYEADRAVGELNRSPINWRHWEWGYLRRRVDGSLMAINTGLCAAVAFTPDGSQIVTLDAGGTVTRWDAPTGVLLSSCKLKSSGKSERFAIFRGSIDASTNFVAAYCRIIATEAAGSLRPSETRFMLWDARTGDLIASADSIGTQFIQVVFSPDGSRVAAATGQWHDRRGEIQWLGGEVRIWETNSGKLLKTFATPRGSAHGLAFQSDGKLLAVATDDGALRFISTEGDDPGKLVPVSFTRPRAMTFTADGSKLAVSTVNEVRVINRDGTLLAVLEGHTGEVMAIDLSADGQSLLTGAMDRTVRLWGLSTGRAVMVLAGHRRPISGVSFRSDSKRIASVSADGSTRIWSASPEDTRPALRGHADWVPCVAFHPSAQTVYSCGSKKIHVWNLSTGKETKTFPLTEEPRHMSFAADGTRFAVACDDSHLSIRDAANGRVMVQCVGHAGDVVCSAFSRDARSLVSVGADGTARVWDALTGEERLRFDRHLGPVTWVAIHPLLQLVATAGEDGFVRIWHPETGNVVHQWKADHRRLTCLAFSPDGDHLVTSVCNRSEPSSASEIVIWDVETHKVVHRLPGHEGSIWNVTYSADGQRIVSAGEDKTVRIWDAASGDHMLTLKGHGDDVRFVTFSGDGKILASSGDDRTVYLWDATPLGSGLGLAARFSR
jgi:WD40 repeat protein